MQRRARGWALGACPAASLWLWRVLLSGSGSSHGRQQLRSWRPPAHYLHAYGRPWRPGARAGACWRRDPAAFACWRHWYTAAAGSAGAGRRCCSAQPFLHALPWQLLPAACCHSCSAVGCWPWQRRHRCWRWHAGTLARSLGYHGSQPHARGCRGHGAAGRPAVARAGPGAGQLVGHPKHLTYVGVQRYGLQLPLASVAKLAGCFLEGQAVPLSQPLTQMHPF